MDDKLDTDKPAPLLPMQVHKASLVALLLYVEFVKQKQVTRSQSRLSRQQVLLLTTHLS